ncbi:hypothetical protein J4731_06295, partial [Providencia rettgeri]|nr:hypothetical protein [Providencia rettgeri]
SSMNFCSVLIAPCECDLFQQVGRDRSLRHWFSRTGIVAASTELSPHPCGFDSSVVHSLIHLLD